MWELQPLPQVELRTDVQARRGAADPCQEDDGLIAIKAPLNRIDSCLDFVDNDDVLDVDDLWDGDRFTLRSIFVSDVHLGCQFSRADVLVRFLRAHRPQFLYLVGDVVDGWKLSRRWKWGQSHNDFIALLLDLANSGTRIFYTPGNHDEFLRVFLGNMRMFELSDEFIHVTADKRRLLVTHGDKFDEVDKYARWISLAGDVAYECLLWLNRNVNRVTEKMGTRYLPVSQSLKAKVKEVVRFISAFEARLAEYAKSRHCEGIVCGHIHSPTIVERDGVLYCNAGDWVESCSALVEKQDGTLEIVYGWDMPVAAQA